MNFVQTVEVDYAKAKAEVEAGLTYLDNEAKTVLAWVEKEVPASAGAIALFLTGAEAEAASLATKAAAGLATQIDAGGAEVETFLANLISATGFSTNAASGLKAIDASAIALIESIGKGLVTTSLATILAKLAPAL